MAKFKMSALVGDGDVISAKLGASANAPLLDADIGKPVKLGAADTYVLCTDGDVIDGFLVGINPDTQAGYAFGSVQIGGFVACELDGNCAIGSLVECGTIAAVGTAEANGLPVVSIRAVVADIADDAAGALIATAVNALIANAAAPDSGWQLVSGTGLDEDVTAVIKKC